MFRWAVRSLPADPSAAARRLRIGSQPQSFLSLFDYTQGSFDFTFIYSSLRFANEVTTGNHPWKFKTSSCDFVVPPCDSPLTQG